jgi:hypothetical protein
MSEPFKGRYAISIYSQKERIVHRRLDGRSSYTETTIIRIKEQKGIHNAGSGDHKIIHGRTPTLNFLSNYLPCRTRKYILVLPCFEIYNKEITVFRGLVIT